MTAVMLRSNTPRVSSTIAVLWLLFMSRRQASNLLLFAYEARALTRLSYPGIFNEDPWTGARDPLNCCPWACYIGQGLNDFRSMVKMLRHLGGPRMTEVAGEVVHPDQLIWVIVGDRSKIEPGLRELKLGEIHLIDSDGRPVT